ncbi:MAG: ATP-dependent zinc metalloprotease FtsH [Flavobacteriales bacterium]|nr:ATP-dependent zinc metalloprotease FtsH [Flavobacteriales bacterium]
MGAFLLFYVISNFLDIGKIDSIDEYKFFDYLEKGYVKKVVLDKNNGGDVEIYLTDQAKNELGIKKEEKNNNTIFPSLETAPNYIMTVSDLQFFREKFDETKQAKQLATEFKTKPQASVFEQIITQTLVWVAIFGVFYFILFRRMSGGMGGGPQIFNIGKSRAKLFDEKNEMKITFKNVAGLKGAKEEVEEVVDFLKNPDKYTKLGGKIPKGVLLVGPPGTGKTLLAKAVAGEAKVPFFSLSGSDFVEMFVGVGASRVRDLFQQAKAKSPAIIFIDEIDAIGRARSRGGIQGSNDERENTLNSLLTEMDGFGTDTNVIVMAATNRVDVLDKALLRAGRFDRTIMVDLPDVKEREEIFKVHTKNLKMEKDFDVEFMAKQTPGFSGADIANVCNEAALIAARNDKSTIGKQDFLDAVDRIVGGLEKKSKIIKPSEKKRVAFHEAGHATVSWLLEHAAPLVKVTIVPRGKSLGAAWYLPDERSLTTTEQMLDEMCALLGGRAAEQVILGSISTGAQNDLERVYKQANAMVTIYGLSPEVGNLSYYDSTGQTDYTFSKPYSEETAKKIDRAIYDLVEKQYQRTVDLLQENKEKLTELGEKLLEKEVIFREDLEEVFGKRKYEQEIATTKQETQDNNSQEQTISMSQE